LKPASGRGVRSSTARSRSHPFRQALARAKFHVYTADWTPDGVTFFVDGEPIRTTDQSPSYPLQLMLGIYAFPATDRKSANRYPKEFVVDYVRGYRLADAVSGSDPKTRRPS
jgi:beta-glucanase (GH16 family)